MKWNVFREPPCILEQRYKIHWRLDLFFLETQTPQHPLASPTLPQHPQPDCQPIAQHWLEKPLKPMCNIWTVGTPCDLKKKMWREYWKEGGRGCGRNSPKARQPVTVAVSPQSAVLSWQGLWPAVLRSIHSVRGKGFSSILALANVLFYGNIWSWNPSRGRVSSCLGKDWVQCSARKCELKCHAPVLLRHF